MCTAVVSSAPEGVRQKCRESHVPFGSSIAMTELPKRGQRLRLNGDLVTVENAVESDTGVDLIVRRPDGVLADRTVTWEQLSAAVVPENDGQGRSAPALAGLWGRWMQYASPRLRS